MSTTFGIKIPKEDRDMFIDYIDGKYVKIAFRNIDGIKFVNPLGPLLFDDIKVKALDNSQQGINTIGDIKNKIREQNEKI